MMVTHVRTGRNLALRDRIAENPLGGVMGFLA